MENKLTKQTNAQAFGTILEYFEPWAKRIKVSVERDDRWVLICCSATGFNVVQKVHIGREAGLVVVIADPGYKVRWDRRYVAAEFIERINLDRHFGSLKMDWRTRLVRAEATLCFTGGCLNPQQVERALATTYQLTLDAIPALAEVVELGTDVWKVENDLKPIFERQVWIEPPGGIEED